MYVPRAFVHQAEFEAAISKVAEQLPPQVIDIVPTLGDDWDGESAVFFQVVLSDGIPRAELLELTKKVRWAIVQEVQPLEEWGVLAYFNFRTQSEHGKINELALA